MGVAGALLLGASGALAQPSFEGKSKEQIFEESIDTRSLVNKKRARSYLAETYPDSPEGLFSAATIASRNKDPELEAELYLQCLETDPQFVWCLSNYMVNAERRRDRVAVERARSLFERMEPSAAFESFAFSNIYTAFFALEEPDPAAAAEFLEAQLPRMEAVGKAWKGRDALGVMASSDLDHDRAIALMDEAIALGADNFSVWRRQAQARRDKVSPAQLQADAALRRTVTDPILEYAARFPDDASPYLYLARFERAMGNNYRASAYYRLAFQREPQPDLAKTIRTIGLLPDPISDFLDMVSVELPEDSYAQAQVAYHTADYELDFERAYALYEASLERLETDELKREVAADYALILEEYSWEWDKAYELRKRYGADPANIADQLIPNRFRAGDFEAAEAYIELAAERGTFNGDFLQMHRSRIEQARANAAKLEQAVPYLDFLDRWSGAKVARTGAPERELMFAPGTAELLPASERQLDELASLLKSGGGVVDVVEIAGFADQDGATDLAALGTERAEIVRAKLSAASGLNKDRFAIVVPDPALGIARESGNARVTVTPLSSYRDPKIYAPLARGNTNFSVSPDGRFALVGRNSSSVIDLATGKIVAETAEGSRSSFSPNGRMIALLSDYSALGGFTSQKLHILDRMTGLTLHSLLFEKPINQANSVGWTWSSDSTAVSYMNRSGAIVTYDLGSKTKRWTTRVFNRFISGKLAWSPDSKILAVGASQSRKVVLLDGASGKAMRTLTGVDWPRSIAWTPDGKSLVVTDNQSQLRVWDTSTWTSRTRQLPGHPNGIFIGSDNIAYLPLTTGRRPDGRLRIPIHTVDIDSFEIRRLPLHDTSIAFAPNIQRIYEADDTITVRSGVDFAALKVIDRGTVRLDDSAVPKDCACFVTSDATGLHVWNPATGRLLHTFDQPLESMATAGNQIIGLKDNRLIRFDLQSFETSSSALVFEASGGIAQTVAVDGDLVAVGGVLSDRSNRGIVEVRRLSDFGLVEELGFEIVTETRRYRGLANSQVTSVDIDQPSRRVSVTTSWQAGYGQPITYSREARVFEIDDGSLAFRARSNRKVESASFSQRDEKTMLLVPNGAFSRFYDDQGALADNVLRTSVKRKRSHEGREFTVVRTGSFAIEIDWLDDGKDPVRVAVADDLDRYFPLAELNLLVAINKDNSFRFYNLQTGELALTIVAQKKSQWLAYTPAGLYAASVNGADRASLAFGSVVRPLEAYDRSLESREFVAETLASQRTGETIKALANARVRARSSAYTAPFLLSAVSRLPGRVSSETINVEYKLDAASETDADPLIEFWVNGRVLPPENVAGKVEADGTFTRAFDLVPGRNTILAQVLYRGARFDQVSVTVDNIIDPDGPAMRTAAKPKLFFLGVGISDYQEEDADLEFADKDVTEVAKLLEKQKGVVFSDVQKLLLTNEDAKKDDIEELGIYEFLDYASPNDVIVIYLAGHGAQHRNGELFLMTHESDFDRPFTGFKMKIFADFLKNRPQSQKAILFMDMCRAGTLQFFDQGARNTALGGTSQVTAEDVAVELDGSGTIIFSASTGAAPAYEAPEYGFGGHGAFTAAVLEALRGQADGLIGGASGANGFVDVKELESYVVDRVPELTGAKNQQPKILAAFNVEPYALTEAE